MGLMPLEYKDCITDSPYFRQKLQAHEKELDRTSQAIKTLTKEVKEIVAAAKELSKIQRRFSHTLRSFKFECIGNSQTDDEIVIGSSLKEFAKIVDVVEEARESVLNHSFEQIISPLENFRKEAIGGARDGRKKFEKQTFKFYQNQEKYLALSTRKDDQTLQEADASVEMEQRCFAQASLEYVFLLQEVQERKKFEFVETLLSYMYSWLTFYHQGHEAFNDCTPYLKNLQERLQRTRENFQSTRQEAAQLKNKMLEKNSDPGSMDKMYTRQGYLFLMEKKAFGTTWTKHYCQYQKESRIFTMIPYNQIQQKITSTETLMLKTCVRRMSETIDKRFCFDLTAQDRDKLGLVYTLQALCEEDRRLWMDAMDGKEPPLPQMYAQPVSARPAGQEQTDLDAYGLSFITRAIAALEARGLEDQGLYRLVGVSSKVSKLLSIGLDPARCTKLSLDDPAVWETKTITSAVKQYFRNLPQPLMTYALHNEFISAASHYITPSPNALLLSAEQDRLGQRVSAIHDLVHRLPLENKLVLRELVYHLRRVASKSDKNLMTVSNLGVCFGPTMLRPEEETVAAIMDIKFCNIVVEILIEHYEKIFSEPPSELPCVQDSRSLSPFSSSSSSPKSSPPPSHHHSGKHPQPVLQTVVTSFTTSEPQTVHFGTPTTVTTTTSNASALQRSDASSNIKWSQLTPQQQYPPSQHSSIPPPPNAAAQIWGHSTSSSSLNSAGLNHGLTSHSSLNSLTSSHQREGGGGHHYDGGGGGGGAAPATSNHYHPHRSTSRVPATTSNRASGGGLQGACSSSASNLLLLGATGRGTSSADAAVGSSSVLTTTSSSSSSGGSSSSGASQLLVASAAPTSTDLFGSFSGSSSNLLLSNGGVPLSSAAGRASRASIASAIATIAGAPLTFVNPLIGVDRSDGLVSTSSSSESLCSRSSREHNPGPSSSHHHSHQHHHPPHHSASAGSVYHHHHHQKQQHQSSSSASSSSPPLSRARLGTAYPPTFKQHMETNSLSGVSSVGGGQTSLASLPASVNNNNTVPPPPSKAASNGVSPGSGRKPWPSHPRLTAPPLLMASPVASSRRVVRTLYNCVGENESELSFEPNVYLTNVQPTREPGWLMASLNGREGMVPENYVQPVDEKSLPPHLQLELAASHRNTDV